MKKILHVLAVLAGLDRASRIPHHLPAANGSLHRTSPGSTRMSPCRRGTRGKSPPPAAVEAPPYSELENTDSQSTVNPDWTYRLPVPFRAQRGENGCGAAALGMALDALAHGRGQKAPETSALIAELQENGLLYENGTGAEELAALARSAGYPGSRAFQGWTLEQLAGELGEGRPVLVSLGMNGVGQPGHYVTLSGISGDGQYVRYLDPARGEVVSSAEEFLAQWEQQGAAGLSLSPDPLCRRGKIPWHPGWSCLGPWVCCWCWPRTRHSGRTPARSWSGSRLAGRRSRSWRGEERRGRLRLRC